MRILIVEDEPLVAERLERFCREILGFRLTALHREDEFAEAQEWISTHPIDLLLLDLNLRGSDGMAVLEAAVASSFHTIIVSANTDQALRAFEYGVIDFVPKPFSRDRVAQALLRLDPNASRGVPPARRLAVRKHGRVELVSLDDVVYIQGADHYTELVLRNGRRELYDKSLEKLAALLPGDFERVHKSYLVRLSAIASLHSSEGSYREVVLHNGVRLPIGRSRFKDIRGKLLA